MISPNPAGPSGFLGKRQAAFRAAFHGLFLSLRQEVHFRVQVAVFLIMVAVGLILEISRWEWLILLAVSALVLVAELVNTAIEKLVDLVSPEWQPAAGKVKDIGAAAVLVAAMFAFLTGVLIFWPYFLS